MRVSEERIKTNHMLMDELDIWEEFTVKAINDEWTLRYYTLLMNLLNSQVDGAVKWLDTEEAQEYYFDEAQYQYQLFKALEDQWDETLENKYPSVEALLQEVYNRGKAKGYADMREHIRYTDTDKLALMFVREYNFGLIRRLDNDTRDQIKKNIISAILAGENPRSIAPKIKDTLSTRLEGSTFTPMQRATMIARTEISRVQNTGILQSYINEGYTEVKILTAEDNNVCYTCLRFAYEFNSDEICFSTRGKEKIHKITDLLDYKNFAPLHPNCRCTYLSVWETKLDDDWEDSLEDMDIVDISIKKDSSKHPSNGNKDNIGWGNIKTPQDVADYFGFEYAFEEDRHYFFDKKGNTSIIIDRYHTIGKGGKHKFIDFNNSGGGLYDLKEIIKIYDEAPLILKKSTNEILITGKKRGKSKTLGGSQPFLEEFNGISTTKRIRIYSPALLKDKHLRGNVAQTMYHEMFHCFEYSMIKDPKVIAILSNPKKFSKKEREWAKKRLHPISDSDGWNKACDDDINHQEKNGFVKEGASKYADENGSSENWAETGSMVAFNDLEDKSMAVQMDSSFNSVEFDEWVKRHPNKYEFVLSQLREAKIESILFKSLDIFKYVL